MRGTLSKERVNDLQTFYDKLSSTESTTQWSGAGTQVSCHQNMGISPPVLGSAIPTVGGSRLNPLSSSAATGHQHQQSHSHSVEKPPVGVTGGRHVQSPNNSSGSAKPPPNDSQPSEVRPDYTRVQGSFRKGVPQNSSDAKPPTPKPPVLSPQDVLAARISDELKLIEVLLRIQGELTGVNDHRAEDATVAKCPRNEPPLQQLISRSESTEDGRDRLQDVLHSVDSMPVANQQIFELMRDRVNDQKASEAHANHHSIRKNIAAPSEQRNLRNHKQISREGPKRTQKQESSSVDVDLNNVSKTDHSLLGRVEDSVRHWSPSSTYQFTHSYQPQVGAVDIDERRRSFYASTRGTADIDSKSVHLRTSSDSRSLTGTREVQQHRSQTAEADNFSEEVSFSGDIQWLDSWTSASEDVDLRNYRRDC